MVAVPKSEVPSALTGLEGTLGSDPSLTAFLATDFSPEKHVGAAVREDRVSLALEDAQRASTLLTANVRQEVIRRKEALLAEVEAVDALEKEVATVSAGVSTLATATNGLADALKNPYQPMELAMRRMKNLSAAVELVRGVHRFRVCTGKLTEAGFFPEVKAEVSPGLLEGAAGALKELEDMIGGKGVDGLEKVEGIAKDTIAVRNASVELRKKAATILRSGLANKNQVEVEAAVGAFNELGVLAERVNGEVARLLRETQTAIHKGLEAPSGGKARSTGALEVWTKIEAMFKNVGEACSKAILLQQVLSRKYCNRTHLSLLHDTIASNFVESVSRTLSEQVGILVRTRLQRPAAAYVFSALAEGYPKLKSLLTNSAKRVSMLCRVSPTPISKISLTAKLPIIPDHDFIQNSFFGAVEDIETHYLTASLERLTKMTSSFFENGNHPAETEALTLTKALAAELNAARHDKLLFQMAISSVAQAVRLYTSHAEDYAAATAPDDELNGRGVTEIDEWRLTGLYNGMITLSISATRVLGENQDGSGPVPGAIKKELENLTRLCDLLLDGPFATCRRNIENVLKRMHTEDLRGEVGEDGCSVYVLDISSQVSMFADGVISGLARSRSLGRCTLELAKWIMSSFSENVALVFPQSDVAKIRLSTDMARLELAVEALCPARLLGEPYRTLRALRSCILIDNEMLCDANEELYEEIQTLGRVKLGHLILGRSENKNLRLPHRRMGMLPEDYVKWMESHTEQEAWERILESKNMYKKAQESGNEPISAEYTTLLKLSKSLGQEQ